MNPDALDLLAMVARFLDESLSSQVPHALRSDVRAAAKNLADARAELDAAFPLLARECDELSAALGGAAPDHHAQRGLAPSLTGLQAEHARLLGEVGDRVLALQAKGGNLRAAARSGGQAAGLAISLSARSPRVRCVAGNLAGQHG